MSIFENLANDNSSSIEVYPICSVCFSIQNLPRRHCAAVQRHGGGTAEIQADTSLKRRLAEDGSCKNEARHTYLESTWATGMMEKEGQLWRAESRAARRGLRRGVPLPCGLVEPLSLRAFLSGSEQLLLDHRKEEVFIRDAFHTQAPARIAAFRSCHIVSIVYLGILPCLVSQFLEHGNGAYVCLLTICWRNGLIELEFLGKLFLK